MSKPRKISRSFPDITDNLVTLILVPRDGEPAYGTKPEAKKEVLAAYKDGDTMLATWTGKYSSDCFAVTDNVRDDWSRELGIAKDITLPALSL